MPFLKLPGWIAIATGVLQFVITVGGTSLGTAGGYLAAHREYSGAYNLLLQQQESAVQQQQRLTTDKQQVTKEMAQLAQEMQQLIQKCDLKIEVTVPAPQPVQPMQPMPQVQPQPGQPQPTCLEQYEARKARYGVLEERWLEVNKELSVVARRLTEIQDQIAQLPWPIGKVPAALLTSIAWSSTTSAITPLVIAYIAWVLGIVMLCVGFLWLALVQRIFLASPDCYLRTQA